MDALYAFFFFKYCFFVLQLIKLKIVGMILSFHECFKDQNHNCAFSGQ